jgi:hypothetical protein
MQPQQMITALVIGSVLIAVGLIPGLLSGLAERIQNSLDELFPFSAREPRYRNTYGSRPIPGQIWLAVLGMALIMISIFAYFSN